jgi:exodeoxyribonuclease VII small subunit
MKNEIKFETALERLEEIVSKLEAGTLSLDEALGRYEEGVKLARLCTKQLTEAEKKIEILTKTLSGELEAVPFESSEYKDNSEPSANANPSSKPKPKLRKRNAPEDGRENGLF